MSAIIDKYTPEQLQKIVSQSFSYKEVIQKLGYSTVSGANNITLKNRLELYNIDTSHFYTNQNSNAPIVRNESNVFIENSTASQKVLRHWYKKGEYTPYICSICGLEPFWQGKELTLILDHINGSNHDDRLENLRWVCPNCNQQLETTGFKKIRSTTEKNYCVDCGIEISNKAIRCKECSNKHKRIKTEDMPITREQLKNLIRDEPFTRIGAKFNVTDNAIKKWCDKFNLPRTKREINQYSDEQWKLI